MIEEWADNRLPTLKLLKVGSEIYPKVTCFTLNAGSSRRVRETAYIGNVTGVENISGNQTEIVFTVMSSNADAAIGNVISFLPAEF